MSRTSITRKLARTFPIIAVASAALLGAVGPALAQQPRALGIDVSAWQGNLSQSTWTTFRTSANRQYAFIRSSRGGTTGFYNQSNPDNDNPPGQNTFSQRYDDPYFVQNITTATSVGMFAGPYHFGRADIIASTLNSGGIPNNGTDEANHFIQMAGAWMRPGYLLPVFDLEKGNTQHSTASLSSFSVAFSDRIYQQMGIRPIIYANSSYVNSEVNSTVVAAMPHLWIARPNAEADPLTTEPPPALPTYPNVYGVWNPSYPNTPTPAPWKFWQYDTSGGIPGYSSNIDKDAANGGTEFLKDFLVPALWMNDSSGEWTTLTNWNSGQTPVAPVQGPGQVARVGPMTLPTPRLPGVDDPTTLVDGQNDTVILDRGAANPTITLSSGTHNIRKLYVREALNITGGSLTINYDNFKYAPNDPLRDPAATLISAQFSEAVTLSGAASLSVHTLQVDATRTFTLAGGTLTFNTINLMPHSTTPAKIAMTGTVNFNPLSNATATIANGSGSGSSGLIDLGGGNRTFNVGNGSAADDLSVNVPITNGGLTKSGLGTMRLGGANTFTGPVTITGGILRYGNAAGLSSSTVVTVNNGATLDMNGISDTVAGLASTLGQTTGAILQGTANLTVDAASGTTSFGGSITGTGTFTKNGASSQFLTGNNSLGAVNLNAGSLILNGTNTTGAVTVNGGTLGGIGSVSGAVTVNSGGHVAPGASIESLGVGSLTLNTGSVLDIELGAPSIGDLINVTGLVTLTGGSVNLFDAGGMGTGTYTLIDYGTLSGNVANLGTPTGPSGFDYSLVDTGSVINLSVTAIPVGVPGDYNNDGAVDAGDYILWLKNRNTSNPLPNDNNIGGIVGSDHYDLWRANFGNVMEGAGSGHGGAVPEPTTVALLILGMMGLMVGRRSR